MLKHKESDISNTKAFPQLEVKTAMIIRTFLAFIPGALICTKEKDLTYSINRYKTNDIGNKYAALKCFELKNKDGVARNCEFVDHYHEKIGTHALSLQLHNKELPIPVN